MNSGRDLATTSCAPRKKDLDYEARLLCVVDDVCTTDIMDVHFGFATHKTKVATFSNFTEKELKYLDMHKNMYKVACSPSSRFRIERCSLYKGDCGVGAKVVASKPLTSGTVITELCARLVNVRESFLKAGENDFSVVHSTYKKRSQLWLGPASYANHDCESNCDLYFVKNGVACLRSNRAIRVGDEITAFYGHEYFGPNNVNCFCWTCKQKGEGAFTNVEPPAEAIPFLQCAHCPAKFQFKSWLARHMSKHIDIDKCLCLVCSSSFTRKCDLDRHSILHDTTRCKVKCTMCPKKFTRKDDALRHEQTVHRRMSIHKCPDCELTFNAKQNMMYHHNRIHSGQKPFSCPHCEAKFPAPNALYKHKNKHRV